MIINASLPGSGGAKLACGSYVGTGTYGAANKNLIDVGFEPKAFFVQRLNNDYSYTTLEWATFGFWMQGDTSLRLFSNASSTSVSTRPCSVDGTKISWYGQGYDDRAAQLQLNISGMTYLWFAIG